MNRSMQLAANGVLLILPLAGAGLDEVSAMLRKMFRKDAPVFSTRNLRQAWRKTCAKLGLSVYEERRYRDS